MDRGNFRVLNDNSGNRLKELLSTSQPELDSNFYEIDNSMIFNKIATDELTILDFWKNGCKPCKVIDNVLERLLTTVSHVEVLKINTEYNPNIKQTFNVQSHPTLLFYKNGILVESIIGSVSTDTLESAIYRNA